MNVDALFWILVSIVIVGFLADTWLETLNFRHSQAQAWKKVAQHTQAELKKCQLNLQHAQKTKLDHL